MSSRNLESILLPEKVFSRTKTLGIDPPLDKVREIINPSWCVNTYTERWTQKKVGVPDQKKHLTLLFLTGKYGSLTIRVLP